MNIPTPSDTWPDTWKLSFKYDQEEVFGHVTSWPYYYSYKNRKAAAMSLLCRNLLLGSKILDIAAGQGNFSLELAEKGYDVHWNDLRADLVGYVKLKHESGKITYHPGNVFDLVFDTPFDAILITEVIEHVAHPDQFLQKVATLVKPGGRIVMTTPNGAYIQNTLPKFTETINPSVYEQSQFKPDADGHIFLLHPEELPLLATLASLRLDSVRLLNNPLTSGRFEKWIRLRYIPNVFLYICEYFSSRFPTCLRERYCNIIAARFVKEE